MRVGLFLCAFGILRACGDGAAHADDAALEQRAAEILATHCVRCHNEEKTSGELSLTSRAALLEGGESGPAAVAREPDESLLVDYVSGDEPLMPKEGARLSEDEVAALRNWIEAGLPWAAGGTPKERRAYDYNWWSLRPLRRPAVPHVDSKWIRTPIDAFILAKLQEHGLQPSAEADRRTLIRRLYFDLLGLPPSPSRVDKFIADDDPNAYEKLVDRLLASPRYGERWGRHWLDVVHYADTHGYDKDKVRPNAWPYRDYVIRAFNEDKLYSRFIEEQVAGDVLYPDSRDGVVATGFLAAGPFDYVGQIEVAEGTLAKAVTRNLDRDDMVATTIGAFNSMTAHCARCHDHKFDPITQEDYYSLQAVFAGIDRADRPYPLADASDDATKGGKTGVVFAAATEFNSEGAFTPTHGTPRTIHVLHRGNEQALGAEALPGACGYLPELSHRFEAAAGSGEGERRVALARWLADPRNPLTWRSIVNRVWQYHFGRGIVDSPNDFGRMGSPPTHPELLDWLAAEFRDGRQSIKELHRLICTSATYRQASSDNSEFDQIDGANQYLWRMNRRKLEAETVRDSVLQVAGKLNREAGGPGFRVFAFEDDHSPRYKYEAFDPEDPASHRRSVYRMIVRSVPDPFMAALDCADSSAVVAKRTETITPLQSLALLNDKFMLSMAGHFAERIETMGGDTTKRLTAAWQLALGRPPEEGELASLAEYADEFGLPSACRLIFNLNEFVFID